MPYDSGHYSWRWTDKCKGTIVKYANDIKLESLIIIPSLNSLCKEIPDDIVRTTFITMNKKSAHFNCNYNSKVTVISSSV